MKSFSVFFYKTVDSSMIQCYCVNQTHEFNISPTLYFQSSVRSYLIYITINMQFQQVRTAIWRLFSISTTVNSLLYKSACYCWHSQALLSPTLRTGWDLYFLVFNYSLMISPFFASSSLSCTSFRPHPLHLCFVQLVDTLCWDCYLIISVPLDYLCPCVLSFPPHDGYPCCSLIQFPLPGHVQGLHLLKRALGAQTKNGESRLTEFSVRNVLFYFLQKIGLTHATSPFRSHTLRR